MVGNTEMVGDKCVCLNHRARPFYARKCKRERSTNIEENCVSVKCSSVSHHLRRCKRKSLANMDSLPDDLLFKILLHIPAQDIYEPARLVCRKWNNVIHSHNFIDAQFQNSTSGLLIQFLNLNPIFISMRAGCIEISKYNYKFRHIVWTSCNGLTLEYRFGFPSYRIKNPVTKQRLVLPQVSDLVRGPTLAGIGYAAASMEYKVVSGVIDRTRKDLVLLGCAIITVGVDDSWRNVRCGHLPDKVRGSFYGPTLTTEGFIHWASYGPEVLTLNVESETITETHAPIPRVYGGRKRDFYYISTGKFLSLLVDCGNFVLEVWEMKPESGEWRKLPNINLEAHKCRFEELWGAEFGGADGQPVKPVGWLEYPEVLLFVMRNYKPHSCCVVYRIRTQELDPIELPEFRHAFRAVFHKNSLLWIG